MRVLIAIHGFPPTYYAGAERAAERIARWLVDHGHHVEVFTLEKLNDPHLQLETRTENGIIIHRLYIDLGHGDAFRNLYDDARIGDAFRRVLAQGTFDVVHVVSGYMLGGQVIHPAKEAGLPVVLTLTEFWWLCFRLNLLRVTGELCSGPESDEKCMRCIAEDRRRFRIPAQHAPLLLKAYWPIASTTSRARQATDEVSRRREMLFAAINNVDLVICPSKFIMGMYSQHGFNMSRAVHLRHGLHGPSGEKKRSALSRRSKDSLRLGYVGQIKHHKGVDLIVDAVTPLLDNGRKLTLNIWGSRSGAMAYGDQLEQRTLAYPVISWSGSYSSDQLWDVLAGFDVLVVPSRCYENSPTVILEAFHMGIPVIATRLGGMAELVQHGHNGLLFELNDPADLRRQIVRLLDEPDLLDHLRANIPPVPTIDDEVGAIYQHYQRLTGHE